MGSELQILALYGILVVALVLLQVVLAIPQLGLGYLLGPRDERRRLEGVAGRSYRALENSGMHMALFAAAILALGIQDRFSETTLFAAQIFLVARVIYAVVYLAGIPVVRTLAFVLALLANAWLFLLAL